MKLSPGIEERKPANLQDWKPYRQEKIHEMSAGEHSNIGVIAFAVGFSVMMALDVALG